MLSEEEKNAIEKVEYFIGMFDCFECSIRNDEVKAMEIVLNLVEKQSKELEEKTTMLFAGAEKVKQLEEDNKKLDRENQALFEATVCGDIELLVKNLKELKEENRFLKYHEYTNACECCKKEFHHKRLGVRYCKKCSAQISNHNYYRNLSDEKKKERAEKSKLKMREIRAKKKLKQKGE